MNLSVPRLAVLASALLLGPEGSAETISINFFDDAGVDAMLAADLAGVSGANTRVANWNNVQAAASGSLGGLLYSNGSNSGASINFTSDLGAWRLPTIVPGDGDDRMWKGYLDAAATGASITLSGLSFVGTYDVYVYFDGENGTNWRVANFTIGAVTDGGEDSENTSWGTGQNAGKTYQLPVPGAGGNLAFGSGPTNNDEGNYVILSGISGSSFTLSAVGGANAGNATFRAPVNGIQIVGTAVPEPASAAVFLFGVAGLLATRRRVARR